MTDGQNNGERRIILPTPQVPTLIEFPIVQLGGRPVQVPPPELDIEVDPRALQNPLQIVAIFKSLINTQNALVREIVAMRGQLTILESELGLSDDLKSTTRITPEPAATAE